MASTMAWPPVPVGGRIKMVEGVHASVEIVLLTLGDLSANPFNPSDLSLGDVAFKQQTSVVKGRIEAALRRLKGMITVNSVSESKDSDGNVVYEISFTDRESREMMRINFNG